MAGKGGLGGIQAGLVEARRVYTVTYGGDFESILPFIRGLGGSSGMSQFIQIFCTINFAYLLIAICSLVKYRKLGWAWHCQVPTETGY